METRVQTGTLLSGIGHAGLILWVILGDWLFSPAPTEDVIVTQVSMMTTKEFDALQAAAATPTPSPRPQPKPEPKPEPVVAEPPPEAPPEVIPEPLAEPPPETAAEPVPETPLPPADVEQPLQSTEVVENPTPEAADTVAPSPEVDPTEAEVADTATPSVSDQPSEAPAVEEPPKPESVAEDTGDVLLTEANQDQTDATGLTTSPRPKVRPERPVEEDQPEPQVEEQVATAEPATVAATDDAIAAALAEAAAEETSAEPAAADLPQGPPLSGGEMGDISSAIARKWNLGASSSDALRTKVVIRVSFAPDGKPTSFELIESDGPTDVAVSNLFATAKRAVTRAYSDGGLPLPDGKYETWRVLDLVFDANGMALR